MKNKERDTANHKSLYMTCGFSSLVIFIVKSSRLRFDTLNRSIAFRYSSIFVSRSGSFFVQLQRANASPVRIAKESNVFSTVDPIARILYLTQFLIRDILIFVQNRLNDSS